MAERSTWTDERIDDLVEHLYRTLERLDGRFERLEGRFERLEERVERIEPALAARIDRMEATLGARIDRVDADLSATQRQFALIGWSIAGLVMAQLVAGIVTALVALT